MRFPWQMVMAGALALATATANAAFAESYVCQATVTNGLSWRDGAWIATGFTNDTIVVKDVPERPDDQPSQYCHWRAKRDVSALPTSSQVQLTPRCLQIARVGEQTHPSSCVESRKDGAIFFLNCEGVTDFRMNSAYEFFRSATLSGTDRYDAEGPRDDIFVSVGKCSLIE